MMRKGGKRSPLGETFQVSKLAAFRFQAIDVWMGACTAFIFAALIEFTFVNYLWRRTKMAALNAQLGLDANGMKVSGLSIQPRACCARASDRVYTVVKASDDIFYCSLMSYLLSFPSASHVGVAVAEGPPLSGLEVQLRRGIGEPSRERERV